MSVAAKSPQCQCWCQWVPLPVPATCAAGECLAPAGATSRGLQGSALAQFRCVGLSWAASSILASLVQGGEKEHRVRCPSLGHRVRCPTPPAAREAPPEAAAGCRTLIPFHPKPFYVSEVVQDAEILCPSPSSPHSHCLAALVFDCALSSANLCERWRLVPPSPSHG